MQIQAEDFKSLHQEIMMGQFMNEVGNPKVIKVLLKFPLAQEVIPAPFE